MESSVEYWKNAALEREEAVHFEADEAVRQLLEIYENAYDDLQGEIKKIEYNYSVRFGVDAETASKYLSRELNRQGMNDLAELLLKCNEEERAKILEYIQRDGLSTRAYGARASRYKELQDIIQTRAMKLAVTARTIGEEIIKTAYKNNYYRLIDDVARGIDCGVSFTLIDDNALATVLEKRWSGKRFSERVWTNTQKLADETQEIIARYIVSGRSLDKAVGEIRERYDVAQTRATTLIRTEMAHARAEGDLKAYEELEVEEYKFMASLDERTCDECGHLDGRVFKLSEAVEGENYPVIHPRCRCTTTVNMDYLKRRAYNPVTGKGELVDGSLTYDEWVNNMTAEEKAAFDTAQKKRNNAAADKRNEARADDLFYILPPMKGDAIKASSIYKELNKSDVGRTALDFIKNNSLDIEINYTDEGIAGLRGYAQSNHIVIHARNTQTVLKTTQTLIHEITHIRNDIGGTQWAEAVCFAQEMKHVKKELTFADKRSIIKDVKRLYPHLSWR